MASNHNFNPDPGEKLHHFGESVDLMDLIENVASDGSCTTPVYIEYAQHNDVEMGQNVVQIGNGLQPQCSSSGSPPEIQNVASKADSVPTSSGYVSPIVFIILIYYYHINFNLI